MHMRTTPYTYISFLPPKKMEVTNYPTTQSLNDYNVSYEVYPHSTYQVISSISRCGGLLERCGRLVVVLCVVSCSVSSVAGIKNDAVTSLSD